MFWFYHELVLLLKDLEQTYLVQFQFLSSNNNQESKAIGPGPAGSSRSSFLGSTVQLSRS